MRKRPGHKCIALSQTRAKQPLGRPFIQLPFHPETSAEAQMHIYVCIYVSVSCVLGGPWPESGKQTIKAFHSFPLSLFHLTSGLGQKAKARGSPHMCAHTLNFIRIYASIHFSVLIRFCRRFSSSSSLQPPARACLSH